MNVVSALRPDKWSWMHNFMLTQFILQIILLIPGTSALRTLVRIGSFGLSLYLLWAIPHKSANFPIKWFAYAVFTILALVFCFNIHLNSVPAGLGQIAMYAAIIGPVFWASRLSIGVDGLRNLLLLIWLFQSASAIVGLLQIYFPGQFQFQVSAVVENNAYAGENLKIVLDNGMSIYRPSGLTDTPGGAAVAGFYAILFGLAFLLEGRNKIFSLLGIPSTLIGFFCIYMSQVRSMLLATCVSIACLLAIFILSRNFQRAIALAGSLQPMILGTFAWAAAVGGTKTLERFTSLFSDSADKVYHENRGRFLQDTIEILMPKYPLGAGLGRWGMMNSYFGKNGNPFTEPIWVEIQWTGWLLDGGIPLVAAYSGAILYATGIALVVACQNRRDGVSFWGAVIFAYNIGMIMITFNYPLFMSQTGMEFWLLDTAIFMAALQPDVDLRFKA